MRRLRLPSNRLRPIALRSFPRSDRRKKSATGRTLGERTRTLGQASYNPLYNARLRSAPCVSAGVSGSPYGTLVGRPFLASYYSERKMLSGRSQGFYTKLLKFLAFCSGQQKCETYSRYRADTPLVAGTRHRTRRMKSDQENRFLPTAIHSRWGFVNFSRNAVSVSVFICKKNERKLRIHARRASP